MRTKGLIQKVKQRFVYKARQNARQLAKSFGISRKARRWIIKDDLNSRAYRITTQPKLADDHKKRRVSCAYWLRNFLRKEDHGKILFTDEKYFSVEGVFNRKKERVYAASRFEAAEQGGINEKSKYSQRIMV